MSGTLLTFIRLKPFALNAVQFLQIGKAWMDEMGMTRAEADFLGTDLKTRFRSDGFSVAPGVMAVSLGQAQMYANATGVLVDKFWGWQYAVAWNSAFHSITFATMERPEWQAKVTLLKLLAVVSRFMAPDYAYCVDSPLTLNPLGYASGTSIWARSGVETPSETLASLRISSWLNDRERLFDGQALRDAYPISILGDSLLSMDVGGQPLQHWIRAQPHRGRLSPIGGGAQMWEIAEASDLERTRVELGKAGKLIAYLPESMVAKILGK